MSIRLKSIFLVAIGIITVLGIALYLSGTFLLSRYDEMEKERTEVNIQRVSQAFNVEKSSLSTKVSDWSTWDDAYQFIEDINQKFIESNLQNTTLENLKIYAMIFAVPGKRIVYSKAIDVDGELSSTLSANLQKISTSSALFAKLQKPEDEFTGVVIDGNIPFILSARPILPSSAEGESRGVVIFMRKITKTYAKKISEVVQLPIEIQVIDRSDMTEDLKEELSEAEDSHIEVFSDRIIEADYFEKDIFGNPALYFHMELPRDIHAKGVEVVRYIAIFGGLFGVIILLLTIFVLDRLVLKRITETSKQIVAVGKKGTLQDRIPHGEGTDEISKLIASVNGMLQSIEYGQKLLSDERQRMQQYIDSADVMFIALSSEKRILLVNKKTCEVFRSDKKDLFGKDWLTDIVPQSHREQVQLQFESVLTGQTVDFQYYEHPVVIKDNIERIIGWHNSILKNDQGNIVGIIISGEDITDRKKNELAVEKKNVELESTKTAMLNILEDERKLEVDVKLERDKANTIISTISDGIFVVNRENIVEIANEKAAELLGVSKTEIIGKRLTDVTKIYKDGGELVEKDRPLIRTMNSGEILEFGLADNHYFEGKNGKFPVAISTSPLKVGDDIIGGLITFRNISKEKEIKETIERQVTDRTAQLVEEQARFMASIRNLSLGYIMTDIHGKVILINEIAHKILNIPEANLRIEDIASAFQGIVDIKHETQLCTESRLSKQLPSVQYQSRWVRLFIAPIITQSDEKNIIGHVYILEDVTESKMVERSKDEFFSIASHELRTPLTAIRGNTSMIQDFYSEKLTDPDLKEMIADIHASSIRLIDIVNDFLNVSRFEQGKIEFKKTKFDLKELSIESVKEFEGAAKEKNVVIRFEDTGAIPLVFADRDRTKQAILNLIGNSLKFTEKGEVVVRLVHEGSFVRVLVHDTGRGISKENQNLLFRKFQQAGSSLFTRDTTKGTGLGLYISRMIIEGMGGKIWLEKSEEGVGSEFCFTLPIAA